MRKLTALCGALVLTLAMAAPAAANQKVWVEQESGSFVFPPVGGPAVGEAVNLDNPFWTDPMYFGNDWACSEKDIFYQIKGKSDLWLWYPNNVAEEDMMPDGEAWPWIKGKVKNSGTDYFAANADMTKKVISGKYNGQGRIYDHVVGNPESWKEQFSGKGWGLNIPGYGTVIHESGMGRGMVEVTFDAGEVVDFKFTYLGFRGNQTFDYDELCAYYDAGPAEFLNGNG
jgi:hypothetical protein